MTDEQIKHGNQVINAYMGTKKGNYYKDWNNLHPVLNRIYYNEMFAKKPAYELPMILQYQIFAEFEVVFNGIVNHIEQKDIKDKCPT